MYYPQKIKIMRSPKNKFYAEACFDKALKEIGSVLSVTANTLEEAECLIKQECQRLKSTAYITIRENMAVYPSFDWKEVKTFKYDLK